MSIRTETYNENKIYPFVFHMNPIDIDEVKEWMYENIGEYQGEWVWYAAKYGRPQVYIREELAATAFKLRWS